MEKLDKVLSLNKQVISGYHSFNSVGIGEDKQLHLLGCVAYGKGMSGKDLQLEQIRQISSGLKKEDSEVVLIHGLDREFDDKDEFALIDKELGDKFVIRLKVNRVSGLQKWHEQKGKEVNLKLKDAPFARHFTRQLTNGANKCIVK
jgi:hypothetical protein